MSTTETPTASVEERADDVARAGYFGRFGGQYVPESLSGALAQLVEAWADAQADPAFEAELDDLRRNYGGRPTPLYHATRLSEEAGVEVWLKREDLRPCSAWTARSTWAPRMCAGSG
ncbi:MAG: hypothetical protein LC679_08515 [Intrasporangiaceae bacterium]|nr:hypothetical protein [Intrasporangiaceae bacterium]